jgi:DNA (cytosine-5)-methyltransferase 1
MPRAFLFENVKGLLREGFADYLEYTLLQLGWPELPPNPNEEWLDHRERLFAHRERNKGADTYRIMIRAINAADYGAAQKRHRVMIIGIRSDVADQWEFPRPTHSLAALAWAKAKSGSYWSRHGVADQDRFPLSREEQSALRRLDRIGGEPTERPWVTVRDQLSGLGDPSNDNLDWNHNQHPGARSYAGHTGCHMDEPAKALKAGMHGVPGGENILALTDKSVRYFTVREMARLQGLPDDFLVTGSWRHVTRQLGNAVPAEVGEALGLALASILTAPQLSTREMDSAERPIPSPSRMAAE